MNKREARELDKSFKNNKSLAFPDFYICTDELSKRLTKKFGITSCENANKFHGFDVMYHWGIQGWLIK